MFVECLFELCVKTAQKEMSVSRGSRGWQSDASRAIRDLDSSSNVCAMFEDADEKTEQHKTSAEQRGRSFERIHTKRVIPRSVCVSSGMRKKLCRGQHSHGVKLGYKNRTRNR